jgi:uncharacterized protein
MPKTPVTLTFTFARTEPGNFYLPSDGTIKISSLRGSSHPNARKKVFLVGATGRTGRWILSAALASGLEVTALVRNPPKDRDLPSHPSLKWVSGDLLELPNLEAILRGHDAIFSALNSAAVANGTKRLVAAAQAAGVECYIGLAGGGILQLDEAVLRRDRPGYPTLFVKSSAEHLLAWKALEASSLRWTLICTPDLLNEPARGLAKMRAHYMPEGGRSVPSGDVAEFFVRELKAGQFPRMRVGFTA